MIITARSVRATAFLLCGLALFGLMIAHYEQSAAGANQLIVPETPRSDLAPILDGLVYDAEVAGEFILVGGSFTEIEIAGTPTAHPYLVVYNLGNGSLSTAFQPSVNGPVYAITKSPQPGHVFIAGKFTTIAGQPRQNIAELELATGNVTAWEAPTAGKVTHIEVATNGSRMFIAGTFTHVHGIRAHRIAEVDPNTGALNPAFSFEFSGTAGRRGAGQNIRMIGLTPDNRKLAVVHTAAEIGGLARRGAAVFDVSDPSNPSLTPFSDGDYDLGVRHPGYAPSAGAIAPDGSGFALNHTGNTNFYSLEDNALVADAPPVWSKDGRDSVYSLAISDQALYVGGHFCKIEAGPGPTDVIGGGFTDKICSGSKDYPNDGAFRHQIAALDRSDGTPLSWDPGTDAFNGVRYLEVTDRGLLLSSDGLNHGGIYTGRFAFFDLGATPVVPPAPVEPPVPEGPCNLSVDAAGNPTMSWDAVPGEDTYVIRRNGSWLSSTSATTFVDTQAVAGNNYDYVVRYRMGGVTTDLTCGSIAGTAGQPSCSLALSATGKPELAWNDVPANSVAVRRDGRWLVNVSGESYVDSSTKDQITYRYAVRYRANEQTIDVNCGAITTAGSPVVNRALNQPATQSSTWGGSIAPATRAVDGNTDGAWGGGSVSHTAANDTQPWWQVDLGVSSGISTVELWNRTDCCDWRLADVVVFVSNADMTTARVAGANRPASGS